jgi:hypothetical protein
MLKCYLKTESTTIRSIFLLCTKIVFSHDYVLPPTRITWPPYIFWKTPYQILDKHTRSGRTRSPPLAHTRSPRSHSPRRSSSLTSAPLRLSRSHAAAFHPLPRFLLDLLVPGEEGAAGQVATTCPSRSAGTPPPRAGRTRLAGPRGSASPGTRGPTAA